MNPILAIAILAASFAFVRFAAKQYPDDSLTASVASGCFCLLAGFALAKVLS